MVNASGQGEGALIAVIGAGFAGASAALSLADAGRRVLLLEAGRLPGGRARSFLDPRSGLELDWGPHLFMRANSAIREFLERIGASPQLRFDRSLDLTYRLADESAPGGLRRERLAFPGRGGVLGALWGLFRWRGPNAAARFSILKGLARLLRESPPSGAGGETVDRLLAGLGQGESERKWFWEPFSRAVLNVRMEEGSGDLFRRVVAEAFGAGPSGAALGSPGAPMGPFWGDRACDAIRRRGGEVRMSAAVRRIRVEGGVVRGVILSGGELLDAARVIAAVPPPALLGMLPDEIRGLRPWSELSRLKPGPIASVYLWLDRPEPGPAFEAIVNEPWQWLFRPRYPGEEDTPIALLCGGADSLAAASRDEMTLSAERTAARIFPGAGIRRVLVVRERAATWATGVGEQAWRPAAKTPVEGLILAGDWTATQLPATCEGAVRSGIRAAEVALAPTAV
jgi:squalene-associated FAD-dependent desaturase